MKGLILRVVLAAFVISTVILAAGTVIAAGDVTDRAIVQTHNAGPIAIVSSAARDSIQFEECGELFLGTECILFRTDDNHVYYPDSIGTFGVGDRVRIEGILDPECLNLCLEGEGCIYVDEIESCAPTPAREMTWSRIKSIYR